MMTASNIHYEVAKRLRGLGCGGIGAVHLLARRTGLIDAIDRRLHLLKVHLPYHESDHVLNIAYNILVGGTCLQDIELRRNHEAYLDALVLQRNFGSRIARRPDDISFRNLYFWKEMQHGRATDSAIEADVEPVPGGV